MLRAQVPLHLTLLAPEPQGTILLPQAQVSSQLRGGTTLPSLSSQI
uniref:Uncharacterized protein n=1 Tax=Anguilla anguilla TaxID=7936 RepID=A0A0E9VW66_ANGAN